MTDPGRRRLLAGALGLALLGGGRARAQTPLPEVTVFKNPT